LERLKYNKKKISNRGFKISLDLLVTGLQGISSSGKTYIAQMLGRALVEMTSLNEEDVTVLDLDNFYRPIEEVYEIQGINPNDEDALLQVNWDDPNLIDYEVLVNALEELIETGETIRPIYDKSTGKYLEKTITYRARKIVLIESFLLFSAGIPMEGKYTSGKPKTPVLGNPNSIAARIEELVEYKIGVICDSLEAWRRRISRDTQETTRNPQVTNMYWERDAMPGAEQFIFPLLYAGPKENIFDTFIDNTMLHVVDIDDAFCGVLEKAQEKELGTYLDPRFHDAKKRMRWFADYYMPIVRTQASQAYETFRQNNGD